MSKRSPQDEETVKSKRSKTDEPSEEDDSSEDSSTENSDKPSTEDSDEPTKSRGKKTPVKDSDKATTTQSPLDLNQPGTSNMGQQGPSEVSVPSLLDQPGTSSGLRHRRDQQVQEQGPQDDDSDEVLEAEEQEPEMEGAYEGGRFPGEELGEILEADDEVEENNNDTGLADRNQPPPQPPQPGIYQCVMCGITLVSRLGDWCIGCLGLWAMIICSFLLLIFFGLYEFMIIVIALQADRRRRDGGGDGGNPPAGGSKPAAPIPPPNMFTSFRKNKD